VIHIGHADSGHYYSFIKERTDNGRWFEFNDTVVRPFDIKKLSEEAFGG
jgi:ubiquitin C-terminal hydrolase